MTNVNKVSTSAINNTSQADNKQQIKPNNLKYENDKVEVSKSNKKKNIKIGLAAAGLAWTAACLVYSIGRNPATAAKVIKGHSNILTEAYKEGQKLAEEVINKQGAFSTTAEDVLQAFTTPKHKTNLEEKISRLEKFLDEKGVDKSADVRNSVSELKRNLQQFITNQEQKLLHGGETTSADWSSFAKNNEKSLTSIKDFLSQRMDVPYDSFSMFDFQGYNVESLCALNPYISECPKEILPNNGVFYHGTTAQRKIYKTGFSPFVSKQINSSARELGAGVYVTPDVGVAAYFSGLYGSIIPVKLANNSKVAFVTGDSAEVLSKILTKFKSERMSAEEYKNLPNDIKNAMNECLIREFFKKAGYDAAYIPKGITTGGGLFANIFSPDINKVIGKKQEQLVVFNPENIKITSRGLKDRICDVKDKFESIIHQIKWQREHPFGF